ncbi:MAG: histidine kinase [Acidobacteria bacterium]|nr:histidine kinase [Acidobacteriota bacterium]
MSEQLELDSRYGMRTEQFSELMAYRVLEILLVASDYDAFILEEDGQLTELMSQEYRNLDLNISQAPRFTTVSSGRDALQMLTEKPFDMVVTTARLPDMKVREFGREVKEHYPGLPVGVLAAHAWETPLLEGLRESGAVDWVFLWLGDVKALLAMIKQQEDRRNADHDVLVSGVQAIIVVEDEVRFFSFFLPHMYTEVTQQTARLMAEGLNLSHRLLRMRARPKILLAQTFEEAWDLYERYAENVLGIITDINFPRQGRLDATAGVELARRIRERDAELPILLQSSDASNKRYGTQVGAAFVHKDSPNLLAEMQRFMLENFGFGDFILRLPDHTEVGRAKDLRELLEQLELVPDATIEYHANHNHFSRWYTARTEFELAAMVRPRTVTEFPSIGGLRSYLSRTLLNYLREIQRNVITDFDVEHFDEFTAFAKIGSGSLGGKGRGLAFMQKLLAQERITFPGVELTMPQTLVVASDVFDDFLDRNHLEPLVQKAASLTDTQILDAFRGVRFDRPLRAQLAKFLETVREPLAVRSSSILEDSPYQPFAGVYATIMLANSHPSLDVRLAQLLEAIKVVYASTYLKAAREYLETTPHRIEEERMAVLVQRLVGSPHGQHFYPTFSGVASSYNFYPFRNMKPEDGVALVAVGLGKSVVEGFEALRFCPAYPQVLPQFSSVKDILKNAQRSFWALDMSRNDVIPGLDFDGNLVQLDVTESLDNGCAQMISSTYLPANDALVNGVVEGGMPVISFARLLKGQQFPLPAILTQLLRVSERGMGIPVEIEFAVDLRSSPEGSHAFHVLQIRPMVVEQVAKDPSLDATIRERAVVFSEKALGHGRSNTLWDLVVVAADLERARTTEVAMVLERLNHHLRLEGRSYVLIGPGRWGSRDPWLGIPVRWAQISSARAIVETDFKDLDVEPSQGSHFFHNITSFGVAFLAVHRRQSEGVIDWTWLESQPSMARELNGAVRHIRLTQPLEVLVDGASGRAAIVQKKE